MRIGILPIISIRDLSSEAANIWFHIIRDMLKIRDDLWFYVVLPRGLENYDVYEKLPHTTVVTENRRRLRYLEEVDMVDLDLMYRMFNMRGGIYPIDVFVTEKTGIASLLQKVLSDMRYADMKEYRKIPVVVVDDRVFSRGGTHQLKDSQEFALRAMSYASVPSVVSTMLERDEAIDVSSIYLSESMRLKMKENLRTIYSGVMVKDIEETIKDVKKRDKFTIFWGGRLSAQKRPEFLFEEFLKLLEGGRDIDIIVTSPHRIPFKYHYLVDEVRKRCKNFNLIFDATRKEFLKLCASSHVWMSASMFEGFTIGHIEMAMTGTVGIMPRRPWSEELFGKDYPLLYSSGSFVEAAALLRWVYENYSEAEKIGKETKEKLAGKFDSMFFAEAFLSLIDEIVDKNIAYSKCMICDGTEVAETIDMILEKFKSKGMSRFSVYDVANEIKKFSYAGIVTCDGISLKYPSLSDIRSYLLEKGYREVYEREYPIFELGDVDARGIAQRLC
jgi:glycosyltransferase involved in cell wall biosynthesis